MNLDGRAVLIFEDDLALAHPWSDALTARGADVEVFNRRSHAEQRCGQRQFDAIVCDVIVLSPSGAPVPDGGILFIGHLRGGPLADLPDWCETVPIISVTGAGVSVGQSARSVGADEVLFKPFTPEILADRVERMILRPAG